MSVSDIALGHARQRLAELPPGVSLVCFVEHACESLKFAGAAMRAAGVDPEWVETTIALLLLQVIRERVALGVPALPGCVAH